MRIAVKEEIAKAQGRRDEFEQIIGLLRQLAESKGSPYQISAQIPGYVIETRVNFCGWPELTVYRYGRLLRAFTEAQRLVSANVHSSLEAAFEQELGQTV